MKIKLFSTVFVVLVIIAFTLVYVLFSMNKSSVETPIEKICIATLHIQRGDIPDDYAQAIEKQNIFKEAKPSTYDQLDTGLTLIGVDKKTRELVVDASYFSDINKTDATRINGPIKIGIYKDLSFKNKPRDIINFLLKSHLITTYWHLDANLCLVQEVDDSKSYKADFTATHEYCTNECVKEDYRFSVSIDKISGMISISRD